jgi:hypothetical protein
MRRSDLVKRLRKLNNELRPAFEAAGVPVNDCDGHTDEAIEAHVAKLQTLKEGDAYKALLRIHREQSPEWWANMSLMGMTDTPEHAILRDRSKALRKAWRALNAKASSEPDAVKADPA